MTQRPNNLDRAFDQQLREHLRRSQTSQTAETVPAPLTADETAKLIAASLQRVAAQNLKVASKPRLPQPYTTLALCAVALLAIAPVMLINKAIDKAPPATLPTYTLELLSLERTHRSASAAPTARTPTTPARYSFGSELKVVLHPQHAHTQHIQLRVTAQNEQGATLHWQPHIETAPDGTLLARGAFGQELSWKPGRWHTRWQVVHSEAGTTSNTLELELELQQ